MVDVKHQPCICYSILDLLWVLSLRILIAGVGITSYAAYQQRLQTKAAIKQAQAAIEQNKFLSQQNDLEQVSQGLMTREEYLKQYPIKK